MTLGGIVALGALRRAAGPEAIAGVTRSFAVGLVAASLAAGSGRWLTGTVADLAGHATWTWVAAGAGGALLAAAVVLVLTWLGDRSTFTALEEVRRA